MADLRRPKSPGRGRPITDRLLSRLANLSIPRISVSGGGGHRSSGNVTIQVPQPIPLRNTFLAVITGSSAISGADTRWRYAWSKIQLSSDDDSVITGGLAQSGTTTSDYALNLTELNNIAQGSGGQGNSVDDSGADYPTGFSLQPVGGADGVQVCVIMFVVTDADGAKRYVFQYENADDGTCS